MKRLVVGLLAALLVVTGCGRHIDGAAQKAPAATAAGFFFAGEVPVYGQTVSNSDLITLAYLRAIRRVDVCGLVDRDTLAKVGDISSVGTLFAFDECDIDIKVPGQAQRRFISVQLGLAQPGQTVAFRAGGIPVYETAVGSCEFLMPVDLSQLPGADRLRKPEQPFLRIGMIGQTDCALIQKVVHAVAEHMLNRSLPPRDAGAVYPTPLAERDPCEVLSVIAGDVDHWDISQTRPYECDFGVWRDGFPEVVSMQLSLEPRIVDITTQGREHRKTGDVDIYLDTTFCSAVAFVGPPMQRRLAGGDFIDTSDVVIRPSVIVESGGDDCEAVADVAGSAAVLYGSG